MKLNGYKYYIRIGVPSFQLEYSLPFSFPFIFHFSFFFSLKLLQGSYNYDILKDLLGDGIFAVDGEKWRQQRKISSHEFSTKVLRDFSSAIFRKNAAKLAKILSEVATTNQTIEIQVS